MRKNIGAALASLVITCAASAHAAVSETEIKITKVGCHNLPASNNMGRVCFAEFVYVAGTPAYSSSLSCKGSTQFRWDLNDNALGQQNLSLITAAFLAGKHILIGLETDACFSRDSGKLTFDWLYLLP